MTRPDRRDIYVVAWLVLVAFVLEWLHADVIARQLGVRVDGLLAETAAPATLTGEGFDRARHYHPEREGSAEGPTGDSEADLAALRAELAGED